MAQYPIKMLKDENGTPFVPLVAPEAVKDTQGTNWQTLIDKKLEKTNIIAGDNITLSVSGNDITINSQAGGTTDYNTLTNKPIIPITFTDNMKSDYSISELPGWQVILLQEMINEYLQDNDSINNYILKVDGIQYLEDSNSTFDVSMNYGKTDSLFTFKKEGPYGSIPHAFQFVGSIIVNQKISKGSGYSSAAFRKNGIMIYCDEHYKITDVCQRYKLFGGNKDNEGFFADYISTNDSYTTAYIPTKDYQPATKKYVDDSINGETHGDTLPIGAIIDYDGTTVPDGYEKVADANVYSMEETVIGTWVDGKPIYRKVFSVGGSTSQTISTFENKIKDVINKYGFVKYENEMEDYWTNLGETGFTATIDQYGINVTLGTKQATGSGYLVIEYTKSTD